MKSSDLVSDGLRHLTRWYLQFRFQRGFRWLVIISAVLTLSTVFIGYRLLYTVELWVGNPGLDRWCEKYDLPSYVIRKEPDEITIVTAFLDLGTLKKGENFWDYRTPYKYKRWMRPLSKMGNPLVVYLENDEIIKYVKEVRSCFPESHTKIIKFDRTKLWAFSHLDQIKDIYSSPGYPKYYPNTVSAEYTCAMHAKYEFLDQVVKKNPFKTPAFAWLDIGFFRNLDDYDTQLFKLLPPAKLNTERVAFTQARPLEPYIDPIEVMKGNMVWVAGGMVLGVNSTLVKFISEYRQAVKTLLDLGVANTDQQVIYAMNTVKMKQESQVKIHTYLCHQGQLGLQGADARYFCLGFICKDIWERIHGKGYGH